jgi:flagellar hook protein FlgE
MDATIQGGGFFIVGDANGTFFTRAGNISRDFHNNLHINGLRLMGWTTRFDGTEHVVDRSRLVPLELGGDKQSMPAEPTCLVNLVGNLNITQLAVDPRTNEEYQIRSMVIHDSLGHRYVVDVRFVFHRAMSEATDSPHSYWTMEFLGDEDGVFAFLEGDRTAIDDPEREVPRIGICLFGGPDEDSLSSWIGGMQTSVTIAFNSRGEFVGMGPVGDNGEPVDFSGLPDDHEFFGRRFDTAIIPISGVAPAATFGGLGAAILRYVVPDSPIGPETDSNVQIPIGRLTLDMREFFQRAENTSIRLLSMTGNGPGTLEDLSIGPDGTLMGRYSNGRTRVLGQIPLAFFQNPAGLERLGGNLWAASANSGAFDGVGLIGQMQGGALEMSNVDLANEFTEMITTQRGFQAASRTISVSDEMLQELVNLRR